MCTIVTVGAEEIQSVGALRAHWVVETEDVWYDTSDDDCLCGVNIAAVLERAGLRFEDDPWGYRVIDA